MTGANKGIGRETAAALGRAGFRVGVGSRDPGLGAEAVDQLRGEGIDAFLVPLDVSDDASVTAAAAGWTGGLDVLVNNAGTSAGALERPSATSVERVRTVFETNVIGVLRATNAFLPLLLRSAAPRVVNVTSSMGSLTLQHDELPGSGPVDGAYGPSKTALNALTLQYARELARTPVLVNAVCPGYTATEFTGFSGARTPAQAAAVVVRLATVGHDGPRGGFFDESGALPW